MGIWVWIVAHPLAWKGAIGAAAFLYLDYRIAQAIGILRAGSVASVSRLDAIRSDTSELVDRERD